MYRGFSLQEIQSVVFYEVLRLWEAHLHVFYVSGRLSGGRMSNQAVSASGSAKERPSRAWGRGRGRWWEARFVMFYESLRLWEVHLYVFYVSGRLSGGRMSNGLSIPGGSAKERPSRVLRVGEALGGSDV